MSLDPEAAAKLDRELRAALARGPAAGAPLRVMVTLSPAPPPPQPSPRDREARIAWAREREAEFADETAELVSALEALGAAEVDRHWIARSLSGTLPTPAIEAAARRPEVIRVALVVPRHILL